MVGVRDSSRVDVNRGRNSTAAESGIHASASRHKQTSWLKKQSGGNDRRVYCSPCSAFGVRENPPHRSRSERGKQGVQRAQLLGQTAEDAPAMSSFLCWVAVPESKESHRMLRNVTSSGSLWRTAHRWWDSFSGATC